MFGLGGGEIVVIVIVALIIFGPNKLPEIARTVSRAYKEWTKVKGQVDDTISDLRREINVKAQIEDELAPVFRPDERSRALHKPGSHGEGEALPVPEADDYLSGAGESTDSAAVGAEKAAQPEAGEAGPTGATQSGESGSDDYLSGEDR